MTEVINEFASALRVHGLLFDRVIADGRIHYTSIEGKKSYNKAGRYQLHVDHRGAIGWYMDWTTDSEPVKWRSKQSRLRPTPEQERAFEQERARQRAERERLRKEAIKKANRIWRKVGKAPADFTYCEDKGVEPEGLRWCRWQDAVKVLLVPMYNENNKLVNLERIYPDGRKRFLADGQVTGTHFWVASPQTAEPAIICIAEGWATAETIYQATGHAVVAAFNAGNLLAVAKWVRDQYADAKIILCADDDWKTERNGRPYNTERNGRPYNTGVVKATAAARAVNGSLAVPKFSPSLFGNRKDDETDFNDLFLATDLATVKRQIDDAVEPPEADSKDSKDSKDSNTHDNDIEGESEDDDGEGKKQADVLVRLASHAELFHCNADGHCYADIPVGGHHETLPIRSEASAGWSANTIAKLTAHPAPQH